MRMRKLRASPPGSNWGVYFGCGLLAATAVTVAACCAIAIEDEGAPRTYAVVAGTINGTLSVVLAAWLCGAAVRWHWRRTRGYPFTTGDLVQITRGEARGRQGRVSSHDQGVWCFEIELDAEDGRTERIWISAVRLRKALSHHELGEH